MRSKDTLTEMSAKELIQILDQEHPPMCIQKGESLEDAHRRAGKRELIDALLVRLSVEQDGDYPLSD